MLFGQLCEYVLPYRVGHERPQQLFRLQDSIFHTDIADLLNYDDIGNEVATGIGLSQIFNGRMPREAKVLYRGNLINYNLTGLCEPGYAQKLVGQTYAVSGCSGPESGFPDPERQTLLVGDDR